MLCTCLSFHSISISFTAAVHFFLSRPVSRFLSLSMRIALSIIGLAAFAIMVSAQAKVMKNITIHSNNEWMKKIANRTQGCTKDNVGVRREWSVYITR